MKSMRKNRRGREGEGVLLGGNREKKERNKQLIEKILYSLKDESALQVKTRKRRAEDTFRDVTDARKSVHVFVSLGVWEFDTWIGSKLQEEYLLLVKDAAIFYLATLDVG
ncbi:hypothetical protein D5086_033519 [Populus alba]|uniref:Uncharacterized protein n=1 Tax=Populus alba TaxID=43335 RepID=A0ACC4AHZ8_POPAL